MNNNIFIDGEKYEEITREDFDKEKEVAKFVVFDSIDKIRKEIYFRRLKYIPKKRR